MKKIIGQSRYIILIFILSGFNVAFSSSISRSPNTLEQLKYEKGAEFIKLSFKQFAILTGQKENLLNKFSFAVIKMRIKHGLKKHHDLTLRDYTNSKHRWPLGFRIFVWFVAAVIVIFLLVVLLIGLSAQY